MLDLGNSMDANAKRYRKEFGGSMAAYEVMVPVSMWRLRGHEHTLPGYGIAFLAIIPSVLALADFGHSGPRADIDMISDSDCQRGFWKGWPRGRDSTTAALIAATCAVNRALVSFGA